MESQQQAGPVSPPTPQADEENVTAKYCLPAAAQAPCAIPSALSLGRGQLFREPHTSSRSVCGGGGPTLTPRALRAGGWNAHTGGSQVSRARFQTDTPYLLQRGWLLGLGDLPLLPLLHQRGAGVQGVVWGLQLVEVALLPRCGVSGENWHRPNCHMEGTHSSGTHRARDLLCLRQTEAHTTL